jgi:hypothetical protein
MKRENDMRRILTMAVIATLGGTLGAALADEGGSAGEVRGQAISLDAMKQRIDVLGYDVRRLKVDDRVFKAQIIDRESGGGVKAIFDRTTGELVRARLAS